MARVGLVVHHDRPEAARLAKRACDRLTGAGHSVAVPEADAAAVGLEDKGRPDATFADDLDAVVSFGGDGTMLRAVHLIGRRAVPVMGVNLGHLGFLTEVEPEGLDEALDRLVVGDHGIDERMLVEIDVLSSSGEVAAGPHLALNEAVLEKTPMGHTVRLAVSIGDEPFTTYSADGLIVATPTGSTAYSFSARGPIVDPTHRALVVTPVSPHMLFDRTMVLDPRSSVGVRVAHGRPATLAIDGQPLGVLSEGDEIHCRAATASARLATFRKMGFHSLLQKKFGLADRG